jgi:hypothetical protein
MEVKEQNKIVPESACIIYMNLIYMSQFYMQESYVTIISIAVSFEWYESKLGVSSTSHKACFPIAQTSSTTNLVVLMPCSSNIILIIQQ